MTTPPQLPLSGVLVADFGRVLAAPYATMLLADLGADVIKVEHPATGDDTRAWGPPHAHGEEPRCQRPPTREQHDGGDNAGHLDHVVAHLHVRRVLRSDDAA